MFVSSYIIMVLLKKEKYYIIYLLVFLFLIVCWRIEVGIKVLFGFKFGIIVFYMKFVSKYVEILLINIYYEIFFGLLDC